MRKYFHGIMLLFFVLLLTKNVLAITSIADNASNIERIQKGMNYQDVQAIMSDHVLVGYQKDATTNKDNPIEINNPIRIERIVSRDKVFFAVYYYTKLINSDGDMKNDELSIIVFKSSGLSVDLHPQDKVVGIGEKFLSRFRK